MSNAQLGFEKSGIFPFNRHKFEESDFATTKPTSCQTPIIGTGFSDDSSLDDSTRAQKNITCSSTKCSSVMENVTGKYAFDSLIRIIKSTDVSSGKHLNPIIVLERG